MKRTIKKSSRVSLIKRIPHCNIIKGSCGTVVKKHTKTNTYDVKFYDFFEKKEVIVKNVKEDKTPVSNANIGV